MKIRKIFLIVTILFLSAECVYAADSNAGGELTFDGLLYESIGEIWGYDGLLLKYNLKNTLYSIYDWYNVQFSGKPRDVNNSSSSSAPAATSFPASAVITYYPSSGRMESKLLSAPDSSGNIYYHYIDEDWQGQGYGRVDMSKRQDADPLTGELSHTYSYYQDIDGFLWEKMGYSDDAWSALIATYTYFNNTSNRMESKTLASPDSSENVYYHYIDEDFQGGGYGRVDRQIRGAADGDGAIAYLYYYFDSTATVQYKYSYQNADFTVLLAAYEYNSSGILITKTEYMSGVPVILYTYYDSGNLRTKLISSSGDINLPNWITSIYFDENFYGNKTGRLYQEEYNPGSPHGIQRTTYLAYWGDTDTVQVKEVFVADSSLTRYEYYSSGRLNIKTVMESGIVIGIYEYSDEAVNDIGLPSEYGHLMRMTRQDGTYAVYEDYFPGTDQARYVKEYSADGNILSTSEYDSSGILLRKTLADGTVFTYYLSGLMESKMLSAPDEFGNVYYHYLDEAFYDNGTPEDTTDDYGRVDRSRRGSALNGELSHEYSYYTDAEGRLQLKRAYSDADWTILFATYTFYNDDANLMKSKTLEVPEADSHIYYYYFMNENFDGRGYGRVSVAKRRESDPDGEDATAYRFVYSAKDPHWILFKSLYADNAMTVAIGSYWYYENTSNRIRSKLYTYGHFQDGIEAFYLLDEDFDHNKNGTIDADEHYGRVYFARRGSGILDNDGALSYNYYYTSPTSSRLSKKVCRSSWWSLSPVVVTYFYYNDAANRPAEKVWVRPDRYGNIYYHYKNEDWNNQGYGRTDRSKRETALNGELSHEYSYYADGAGRLRVKRAYSDAGWNTLFAIYTYYNDAQNRMESKTLALPDANGNIYYHYLNENWAGQGYGRTDIVKRQTADPDGAISYKFTFYVYGSTSYISNKYGYADSAMTIWVVRYGYYYYSANLPAFKMMSNPDAQGIITYYYLAENFNGQGYGRVYYAARQTKDQDGAMTYYFYYSYVNPANVIQKDCRATLSWGAPVFVTYTFYDDAANRMKEKRWANPDASGNVYYHYMNEDFYTDASGKGYGRTDIIKRKIADPDGAIAYRYTYASDTSDRVIKKECYSDASLTNLKVTYTYFDDDANRMSSKLLTQADSGGNIYYEYTNEAFYNAETPNEYGRVSRSKRQSDGRVFKFISYYDGTDRPFVIEEYTDLTETVRIATYNYYYSGDAVSGVRKIETGKTTEFEGNFDRPIYQSVTAGGDDYEAWWFYGTVYYRLGTTSYWFKYDDVVVKYDHQDGFWYLYQRNPDNVWEWGSSVYVIDESRIVLYDAIGGNIVSYPNLPPFQAGFADAAEPSADSFSTPPQDEEFNQRKDIETTQSTNREEAVNNGVSLYSSLATTSSDPFNQPQ